MSWIGSCSHPQDRRFLIGHGAHQLNQLAALGRALDAGERAGHVDAVRARDELEQIVMGFGRPVFVQAFEEVGDRDFQDLGQMIEPGCPDAVGAALVFLDLLEGDAELFAQLLLAQIQKLTPKPDT